MAKAARSEPQRSLPHDAEERSKGRSSFAFSEETREALDWIAQARGVSLSEALRRAIRTERYLVQQSTQHHAQIFIETPGKPMKELVLI